MSTKQREYRLVVGRHRYGPGKVHRLIRIPSEQRYFTVCRGPHMDIPYGEIVKDAVVTCKVCLRTMEPTDDDYKVID